MYAWLMPLSTVKICALTDSNRSKVNWTQNVHVIDFKRRRMCRNWYVMNISERRRRRKRVKYFDKFSNRYLWNFLFSFMFSVCLAEVTFFCPRVLSLTRAYMRACVCVRLYIYELLHSHYIHSLNCHSTSLMRCMALHILCKHTAFNTF